MNRITAFIKKHKIITIFTAIVITSVAWWAWVNFSPKPLGDKMEYLGKEDFGNILGFDTHPYSVYYYGTDMNEKELAGYFDAEYIGSEGTVVGSGYSAKVLRYSTPRGTFSVSLYSSHAAIEALKLEGTNKKNVLSLTDKDYNVAR